MSHSFTASSYIGWPYPQSICPQSLSWARMGSRSRADHSANLPDSECSFEEKPASLVITGSPSTDPGADNPPDGGLLAWLQVAGGFFIIMNTWYVSRCRLKAILTFANVQGPH
jgi:hypothetical protein